MSTEETEKIYGEQIGKTTTSLPKERTANCLYKCYLSHKHPCKSECVLKKYCDGTDEGRKDDTGKAPWSLLPFDAVQAIVEVLRFGAKKYAPRNWEKGMAWDRPFDACLRHLTAWHAGEINDPETGLQHLAHAGCCILFLIAYELRNVGKDTHPHNRA